MSNMYGALHYYYHNHYHYPYYYHHPYPQHYRYHYYYFLLIEHAVRHKINYIKRTTRPERGSNP